MSRMKITLSGTCAALLLTAGLVSAQGVLADRATLVTVSAPVTLPGITLPAGTYLFRLADSLSNRNIVQIFDKDRTKIFATLLAVPASRSEVTDESVVTFKETPSERPPAVHFWYYAGERNGQEFAYPRNQAILIATASGESVLAGNYASDIEGLKDTEITRVKPNTEATPAPAAQAPTTPPVTTPAEPQTPAAKPAAPVTPTPEMQPAATSGRVTPPATATAARPARELPKTASELPLVGLVGLLALGGAIAVRALRRPVI